MKYPRTLDPTERKHAYRYFNGFYDPQLNASIIAIVSLSLMIFKNNAFLKQNNLLSV